MPEENNEGLFSSFINSGTPVSEETGNQDGEGKNPGIQKGGGSPAEGMVSREEFEKLQGSYKELQEFSRQRSEEVKELKTWRDRLMGLDGEESQKELELELRNRFDEDPLQVVKQMIDERVKEVRSVVDQASSVSNVQRVMDEVDKEYEVDWQRDWNKIVAEANHFSDEAKRQDPKGVLLKACRLAGVLKPKDNSSDVPFVQGAGVAGQAALKSEGDKLKERILGAKPKLGFMGW